MINIEFHSFTIIAQMAVFSQAPFLRPVIRWTLSVAPNDWAVACCARKLGALVFFYGIGGKTASCPFIIFLF